MGIALGLKPTSLHIKPLGVMVVFESCTYGDLAELKKIIIAISGPIVNLLLMVVFNLCKINLELKQILMYTNLLIIIFNLIPIYPLDGGRVLKSLIRILCNNKFKAEKIIHIISNVLIIIITAISSILILYIKNIAIVFVIIYLWLLTINENKRFRLLEQINNNT